MNDTVDLLLHPQKREIAKQLECRRPFRLRPKLEHLAGHPLKFRQYPRALLGVSRHEHHASALRRIDRPHEHRRVEVHPPHFRPASGTLTGRTRRGRRVVDDPARCGNEVGERLEHRIDRSVVSQRQARCSPGHSGPQVRRSRRASPAPMARRAARTVDAPVHAQATASRARTRRP